MPEIDFDSKFSSFINVGGSNAILDIYSIIPALTQQQIQICNTLQYYIDKYGLDDLRGFWQNYYRDMSKSKNLNFLSSMNMKNLLKAYTQEALITGIKVNSSLKQGE